MDQKNVEASTLRKKKTINKGKVKKTIKNTLCRPEPVYWPKITEEQRVILTEALLAYKVEIPVFNKPHWKELKAIPKDQRPKPPKLKRVEGLIFGIAQCSDALKNKQCSAVIIESTVNPRILVQSLIQTCAITNTPVLCSDELRIFTATNFGIPTSCLAIRNGFLQELSTKIENIAKQYKPPTYKRKQASNISNDDIIGKSKNILNEIEVDRSTQDKMKIDGNTQDNMEVMVDRDISTSPSPITFTYLYRSNRKTRVFNPSAEQLQTKKEFIGQDFIKLSDKKEKGEEIKSDSKAYMSMILKRITNNQNRLKRK